jgi:hypothetical protein
MDLAFVSNKNLKKITFPADKVRRKAAILALARDFGYGLTAYPEDEQRLATQLSWDKLIASRCNDRTGTVVTKAEWLANIQVGRDRCIDHPERFKPVQERDKEIRETWIGPGSHS